MATKKKKSTKTSKTVGKKVKVRKPAKKQKPSRKAAKKAPAAKKTLTQKQSLNRTSTAKTASASPKQPKTRQRASSRRAQESDSDSAGQSGDLQGLSNVETADSESVDELLEEGNAFEAGIIEGVEDAGNREGREVHTREVPEDDVPGEYLDED
jgi:hypothetical protein